ncbi:PolA [Schleiferilactobacillus shenzhenensis LY-73]|uniref:DNA polymerase I n=1 Tax=Schleiferilactobacillus shenzhenensis LY-73 TaxID=1231336 RepID=U4TX21_9LACO|nr:PolA [Schleiferilactobacillus shenzhenensis LY-73]
MHGELAASWPLKGVTIVATDKKLLLIDGNSVAFRAFFAMHDALDSMTNHDGLHTNALYAFRNMLKNILEKVDPTNVLVAFDAGKTTFRTKKFAEYKGTRARMPGELAEQLPYMHKMLDAMGIKWYELKDYEADDIIGTMAKEGAAAGMAVTVLTGDRDLTQLASDRVTVQVTVKGGGQLEAYTPASFQADLGITPKQFIDMKALMGDNSDNYPGVNKVGKVTARKLVQQYGSVEGIYEHIDAMKPSKMKENLLNDKEQAFLSKDLATIRTDAPITVGLKDTDYSGPDTAALRAVYEELDFNSFLKDLAPDEADAVVQKDLPVTPLTSAVLTKALAGKAPKAVMIEMLGDNYHTEPVIAVGVGTPDQWYVATSDEILRDKLFQSWLANDAQVKYVFDAKRNYVAAHRFGATINGIDFDMLLVSYLLNTVDNSNDLGAVAAQHGYHGVEPDATVYGTGKKRQIPEGHDVFVQHIAHKMAAVYNLKDQLIKDLQDHAQLDLYTDLERPLAIVLANMEIAGIKCDPDTLRKIGASLKDRLRDLENQIYTEAGHEFNINSTKQLGTVLFDEMKLPPVKKTKTGYSTSVDVLEKLQDQSPIIQEILNYRQLAKIQSTYVDGLLTTIHPDGKIHTRYIQTLTQTGRLSSQDPNLQNIPMHQDEGKQIRKAFVPSHDGWELFDADYSQVELRVLAHVSGDKNMQEAFKENRDIHANTAMKIFHLSDPSQVTDNMRRQAKATNFGIVYGISDYGLSQNIGISRTQAKEFIDAYFEQYPQVKTWTEQIVKTAREQGYVETIMHRRRYLPDINAKNRNLRQFAERTAMNTPIQGSAADIIKVAMINMAQALQQQKLQATMLLQVHDELIFEAPKEEIPILAKLVPSIMDSAVKLAVPLKVDSSSGATWYDVK